MNLDFYDQRGAPIAYSEDREHIYTFDGRPVGYLSDGSVYGYSGKHLGRFENGLIRDNAGNVALFCQECSGGPIKPIKQIKPIKGIKQIRPIKGVRQIKPIMPTSTLCWSSLSSKQFFS